MAVRKSLVAIGFLLFLFGGVAGYFAWSIPRDVKAEVLLRQARKDLQKGNRDDARRKFELVITQYPRTDAGAAAMYALFRMVDQDRADLKADIDRQMKQLASARAQDQSRLTEVEQMSKDAAAAAAKKPEVTKAPAKKPVRHKTTHRRRRRR
jgi:hypothetical protein